MSKLPWAAITKGIPLNDTALEHLGRCDRVVFTCEGCGEAVSRPIRDLWDIDIPDGWVWDDKHHKVFHSDDCRAKWLRQRGMEP